MGFVPFFEVVISSCDDKTISIGSEHHRAIISDFDVAFELRE